MNCDNMKHRKYVIQLFVFFGRKFSKSERDGERIYFRTVNQLRKTNE